MAVRVKSFSILLCDELVKQLDTLVAEGYFTSRSAAVREALKQFLKIKSSDLKERSKSTYKCAYFCSHCGVWIPRCRALLIAFCPNCRKRLRIKPR